jgi:Domain of unknown function (DUF2382)
MTTFSDRLAINWQLYWILLRRSMSELVKTFGLGKRWNGDRLNMQNDDSRKINLNSLDSADEENVSRSSSDEPLHEEELLRVTLYEEVPTIQSEVVVREKVQVRKIITQQTENS